MGTDLSVNNYPYTGQDWNTLMSMYAQNPYWSYGLNSNQTSFKGAQGANTTGAGTFTAAEEKTSSGVGSTIGVIAVLGAATILSVSAIKGGGIKHIGKGFKELITSTKNLVSGKNNLKKDVFTMERKGSNTVCTIPDRINKNGLAGNIEAAAKELGIETNLTALPTGATLKSFTTKTSDGSTLKVFNGRIQSVVDSSGKDITATFLKPTDDVGKKAFEDADKFIKDIISGKNTTATLSDATYRVRENGVTSLYRKLADDNYELEKFVTRKFNSESDVVKGYALKHEAAKTAIKNYSKNKIDGFKVAQAEFEAPGLGTFKIKNDEIVGIQVGDKYFTKDSYEFATLVDANKKVYGKVLKDPSELKNAVFTV